MKKLKNILLSLVLSLGLFFQVAPAVAKSLYVVANHHTSAFDAWNINPTGTVVYQTTTTLTYAGDPAGIGIDNDSETMFITSEFSPGVELIDTKTLITLGVSTGPTNLAGIDVDDVNDIVYTVRRRTNQLYIFDWDAAAKTLTQQSGSPVSLAGTVGAFGLALDEFKNILWVADTTSGVVRAYNTGTWVEDMSLSFRPIHQPVDVAVDRVRNVVYTVSIVGGASVPPGTGSYYLSRYDVASMTETTVYMGHAGVGVAVDEVSGYVYVTGGAYTGDNITVWNTSSSPFAKLQDTGPIGNPAGLAIGNVSFNPLNLTKDDGIAANSCANAGQQVTYQVCYDNTTNPFDVTSVTIVDDLPSEVNFTSATGGGSYNSGTHQVMWNIGTLTAGQTQQCVDLTVTVDSATPPSTTFTNFATIDSDQTPPTTVHTDTEVCPYIDITVDIKPGSCPNPINTKSKGVVSVAILGSDSFDVSQVEAASVLLEGVTPLRWNTEDVSTPYDPAMGGMGAYACTDIGADGYTDLVFKFKTQDLVSAIGAVDDGDVLNLELTGNLSGGTLIQGSDVVIILKK